MVIAPGKDGISAFVILADGEFLPQNLNSEKVVVFRRGDSTNRELKVVKGFGELADQSLIKQPDPPVCPGGGGVPSFEGNPLHQHEDETWWFYEETWVWESGPYETYEAAYAALEDYCVKLQASRAPEESKDTLTESEQSGRVKE
jgi:hypothetical protein